MSTQPRPHAIPPSAVGTRLRFFSRRVFGVWVDAVVAKVGPKAVTLHANFQGVRWTERVAPGTEFYRPSDHPRRGQAFFLGGRPAPETPPA